MARSQALEAFNSDVLNNNMMGSDNSEMLTSLVSEDPTRPEGVPEEAIQDKGGWWHLPNELNKEGANTWDSDGKKYTWKDGELVVSQELEEEPTVGPTDETVSPETVELPDGTSTGSDDPVFTNPVDDGVRPPDDGDYKLPVLEPNIPADGYDLPDGTQQPGEVIYYPWNNGTEYRPYPEPYVEPSTTHPPVWGPADATASAGSGSGVGTGTGTGGAATTGDINIDLGGGLQPPGGGSGMTMADYLKGQEIAAAREKAAREQQAALDKAAREAMSKSEALAAQRLINQDKWNALGGLMGMLGNQRQKLYTDFKGPIGYVNTTTGGYSRYQDAAPEDGGRGPIVGAGDQPGRITAPTSAEVASALGSAPKASSDLQGQIADALGGAASPEAASMAASMGQAAEANEMAAKTAASKQGIDLAKVAYDLGDKKRRLRQGLDQSMVASMVPMIAAKTPDVVKYS